MEATKFDLEARTAGTLGWFAEEGMGVGRFAVGGGTLAFARGLSEKKKCVESAL